MSGPLLTVRGLRVSTPSGRQLLDGVDLDILPGRTLALVGESGGGKSMTCLAVMGLLPRGLERSGEAWLGETPLHQASAGQLRRLRGREMALVMQQPMSCFNPLVRIGVHLRETLAAHDVPAAARRDERLAAALGEVGLSDPASLLPLYPHQLSGGMLQRVMLAMALLLDARLLLADEPTSDLDAASQSRILDLLERLQRQRGLGILLVTHDLCVAARLAHEVAVMRRGRLLERQDAASFYQHPRHPYARRLLQAHYRLHGPAAVSGETGKEAA